jgi:glycine C-acetyltransferase
MTSVRSTRNPLAFLDADLDELRAKGLYRRLRVVESEQAARCRIDGREVITLSSNNYLGLTTHPRLREATARARCAPSPGP